MSVSVEKLENSMVKLTVEVSYEEFDKAVEKVYQKQKSRINLPGFRKGKAPRVMIEKTYGAYVFFEDAANNVINMTYPDAAKESGEEIVSSPSIEVAQLEPGKPFIYTAEVAVKPPVTLGQYKGVEVDKADYEVTAEDVDAEIRREQQKNAVEQEITDRPVQDKDEIKLDFEGFVDGEAFEGGQATDYSLVIGSGSFIPGFEDQLIGAVIGEEKEVNVTFPENYGSKELAGKPAVFKCTVKAIKEKVLPELDDEFASEVSSFSTMEEYKADVEKKLLEQRAENYRKAKENQAVAKAAEASEINIPEPMIQSQQEQMFNEYAQNLQMQGLQMEQYLQYTGATREKMIESLKPQAEQRIRTRLTLEAVAEAEGLAASEEEYEEELKKMSEQYHLEVEKIREILGESEKEELLKDLAVRKAVALIADSAVEVEKVQEPAPETAAEEEA